MSKRYRYGEDNDPFHKSNYPTPKQLEEKYASPLENERYSHVLKNYLLCVNMYLKDYTIPQLLEKQLIRSDLDTVCGYELFIFKKDVLENGVLEYKNFVDFDK